MATHASTYGPVSKTVTCYLKSAISRNVTSQDRKSTRLNSSHSQISYAVFCLKKKKKKRRHLSPTTRHSSRLNEMSGRLTDCTHHDADSPQPHDPRAFVIHTNRPRRR